MPSLEVFTERGSLQSKVARADNLDAYVYRILLNCFRDRRRRRSWGERPTARLPDHGIPDQTGQVDLVDSVHRALADLTGAQREVVMLRYFAHLTEQQTADLLKVPTGTVKSRLSRALAHLATSHHLSDAPEELNS
jgi:RNA polymerase sigma factor (sigma-70 family)